MQDISKRFGSKVNEQYFSHLWLIRYDLLKCGESAASCARAIGLDSANMSRYLSGVTLMPLSVFLAIRCFIDSKTLPL